MNDRSEQPEEPQSERGAPGSRDTGSPGPGGGPADRPSGSFDDEEMTSAEQEYAGTQRSGLPPEDGDTEPVVPPYEGRKESGPIGSPAGGEDANTGGAVRPVEDESFKSPEPSETPGGATTTPAGEQHADRDAARRSDDEGVGPVHQPGVRRAEDKP